MGSKTLTFAPEDYIIKVSRIFSLRPTSSYCYNAFIPTSLNSGMIIGTALFKKYYVKFTFSGTPSVGFALKQ